MHYLSNRHKLFMSMIQMEQEEDTKYLKDILKNFPHDCITPVSSGSFGQIYRIDDSFALKVVSKKKMIKERKLHEAVIEGLLLEKLAHPGIIKHHQTI